MRKHTIAALIFMAAVPADAAIITVGPQNGVYGTSRCLDVTANRLDADGVPVTVYDCHGAGNQQFSWGGPSGEFEAIQMPGTSIFTMGAQRCLDVQFGSTAGGAKVMSYPCNGGENQEWNFLNGRIVAYPNRNLPMMRCLTAPSFNNGTQLIIAICDGSDNQQFHIK